MMLLTVIVHIAQSGGIVWRITDDKPNEAITAEFYHQHNRKPLDFVLFGVARFSLPFFTAYTE